MSSPFICLSLHNWFLLLWNFVSAGGQITNIFFKSVCEATTAWNLREGEMNLLCDEEAYTSNKEKTNRRKWAHTELVLTALPRLAFLSPPSFLLLLLLSRLFPFSSCLSSRLSFSSCLPALILPHLLLSLLSNGTRKEEKGGRGRNLFPH